jgi:hypothetical protein
VTQLFFALLSTLLVLYWLFQKLGKIQKTSIMDRLLDAKPSWLLFGSIVLGFFGYAAFALDGNVYLQTWQAIVLAISFLGFVATIKF